jgi:Galactose oxidase, central domain/Kelch motif
MSERMNAGRGGLEAGEAGPGAAEDRLRAYYRAVRRDPPAGFEARVDRAMRLVPAGRASRGWWRPAAGLAAVAAVILVAALVLRGVVPIPGPSSTSSPVVGTSTEPTPTATPFTTPTTLPPTPSVPPTTLPTGPIESPQPTARPVGSLTGTGAMNPALAGTVAVWLNDGRALLTGGRQKNANGITLLRSQTAEIYDPNQGKFVPTGSMNDPRAGHTATLLDGGKVLVVGGIDASDGIDNLASAELYDPATGKFTRTGSLAQGRAHHTATRLNDGRVLIAGGYGGGTLSLKSAELYDPATGKFTATGSMAAARRDASATLLTDGRVLIAGGLDQYATKALASAEIYDPATGRFTTTGSMATARTSSAAVGLENGAVLIAGGKNAAGAALKSAELYDPATGRFTPAGTTTAAGAFTAVWQKDTQVLFVAVDGLSLYDPVSATFSKVANPAGPVDTATYVQGGATNGWVILLTEGGPAQLYVPNGG